MVILYGLVLWLVSLASGYLGWRLRAPVRGVSSPSLPSSVVASAVEQAERLEQDKREAVLTQHLQSLASRSGRALSPFEAAAEARDLLAQL